MFPENIKHKRHLLRGAIFIKTRFYFFDKNIYLKKLDPQVQRENKTLFRNYFEVELISEFNFYFGRLKRSWCKIVEHFEKFSVKEKLVI